MRVLLVGAGASFSIKDVETGYYDALCAAGVDVKVYALDRRIGIAMRWLNSVWRSKGKHPEDRPNWPDCIYRAGVEALEMALRYDVDWVIAISGMYLHPDVLEMMRRAGLRTSVIFTESPYDDDKQARLASLVDMCWTNERSSVAYLSRFNPRVGYLRAAYDPARHHPVAEVSEDVPAHDVVFVGTGFQERIDLLNAVDWTGIDLGLYGTWTLLPPRHRLRKHVRGGVIDNERAIDLYRRAKIGLNLHRVSRDFSRQPAYIEGAESMNPRTYELAACGVFQLSDPRAEIEELGHIPVIRSADQLSFSARLYLNTPRARDGFALKARQAIEPHTFAARAAQVLADLEAYEQPIAKGA